MDSKDFDQMEMNAIRGLIKELEHKLEELRGHL